MESRKSSTVNLYIDTVKAIYTLAIRNDKVEKSPCLNIKNLKDPNKTVWDGRWLDIWEERKLMAVMPEEFYLIVKIALNTGLRVSEQMSLRWDDVDFRNRQIVLRRNMRPTKAGEIQIVDMSPIAYEAFSRLKEMMPVHISKQVFHWINQQKGYVYPNGESKTRNYYRLNYAWKGYCRMAGIKKCKWHGLRHTFASRMVIDKESIFVVQRLMRHADVKKTQRYSHLAPSNTRDALIGLGNWYNKPDNWQENETQQPSQQPSANTVNY